MRLAAKVGLTLLGESPGEEGAAGAGRRGAGGQQGQQQRGGGKAAPPWHSQACKQAGHHSSSTSICSGWVTSIIGPLSAFIQPRTRRRFPARPTRSRPCSAKSFGSRKRGA